MAASRNRFDRVSIQNRDLALLRGLFESRVMTPGHVATLYFDGKPEAAKKRLQKLKAAGFIRDRRRRAYESSILFLTSKAFAILHESGLLTEYPRIDSSSLEKRSNVSELTLSHELEVMDAKTAFHFAISKASRFKVAEFTTWPLLNQFEVLRSDQGGKEFIVKPDGFIRVHEQDEDGGLSEHTFFLEVDRSSETQDTLVTKASCYFDYYRSGGFAERNGASRSAFKEYPFRVLIVFKTAERRNNTAERLLQNNPPIFTQVCLSTFEEVTADPLGAIWIQPASYRDATKGTPFDPDRSQQVLGYKRQSAREIFIEQRVKKMRIITEDV